MSGQIFNKRAAIGNWQISRGELHLAKRHPANALDYDILRMRISPGSKARFLLRWTRLIMPGFEIAV